MYNEKNPCYFAKKRTSEICRCREVRMYIIMNCVGECTINVGETEGIRGTKRGHDVEREIE